MGEDPSRKWDELAMEHIMSYNKQVHSVNGTTPYLVFYGRDPQTNVAFEPDVMRKIFLAVRRNQNASAVTTLRTALTAGGAVQVIAPGTL